MEIDRVSDGLFALRAGRWCCGSDGQHGIDDVGRELFGQLRADLGGEGGVGDGDQGGSVKFTGLAVCV